MNSIIKNKIEEYKELKKLKSIVENKRLKLNDTNTIEALILFHASMSIGLCLHDFYRYYGNMIDKYNL
jgi:hypothetical protein